MSTSEIFAEATKRDAPETLTFYWTQADLDARGGGLPLEVACERNYALRMQVANFGNPDQVVREPSKDGERVLFRLTWHHGDASAPTERVTR